MLELEVGTRWTLISSILESMIGWVNTKTLHF